MGSSMFVDVSLGDLLWGYEAKLPFFSSYFNLSLANSQSWDKYI
jgi:hypothetical protein